MGFWRGLGKFFGGLVFTLALVGAILAMELVSFSSYENVKTVIGAVLDQQFSSLTSDQLQQLHTNLAFQCLTRATISLPLYEGLDAITLSCNDVSSSNNEQLKTLISNAVVDSVYYKKFSCSYIDCVTSGNQQDILIAFADEGNQFYKSAQTWLWIVAAIGLAIMLASIETWTGRLKSTGFTLAMTGLPFLFVSQIKSLLPPIPAQVQGTIVPIIDNLISSLSSRFIIVLVVGVALLAAGFGLEFYLRKSGKLKTKKK
ncbi:MAG: hypothetical protein HYT70_00035 [Candidatus Aenigmarchaeota archaeon]|nr:hypothetical protein [Candidatus Aenigmarchaeota archaeon]